MERDQGANLPSLEETVGAAIREQRQKHGLTLAQVAEQAGISRGMLSKIENGQTSAGMDTLIVDKDMSLWNLASMFWAMKGITGGDGTSMNMPIAGSAPAGSLKWDMPKVKELVSQLNADEKVTVKGD